MTLETKFRIAQIGWFLIPIILPLLLLGLLPHPRQWRWRAPLVALVGSFAWILFTTEIYYPLYVADSWHRGENPYVRFDSDRLDALKYFLGWVIPAAVVSLAAIGRAFVQWIFLHRVRPSKQALSAVSGDF